MLEWIKLESALLRDSRIKALINEHGFCGLGIYIALRVTIESTCDYGLPLPQVLAIGAPHARRNRMTKILESYDLFEISSDGVVTTKQLCSSPAYVSTHAPASIPAHKHSEIKKRTDKEEMRFRKPTLEEIAQYCHERNNGIDPQRFLDYQTARGWMIGKAKMKDWRAAVRTWERSSVSYREKVIEQPLHLSAQSSESPDSLIPSDAPPKPSPSALWDFATDSWNDFY